MRPTIKVTLRLLAFVLPLAIGAVVVGFAGDFRQPPAAKTAQRRPTAVRVITLAPVEVLPRVSGFGTVAPAREWHAVARVQAEVVETHPRLRNGEVLPAGTALLRLDDTDLRLALAEIDSQLAALTVKDQTLAATRAVMQSDLELSRADLARQRQLVTQGTAAQASLDNAQRIELAARAKVVEVENALALNAAEREVLNARRASVARSLDFTVITAPYDLRLTDVAAELGQVVTAGQTLLAGEGTEAVEIAAQFPIGRLGPVIRAMGAGRTVADLKARVRLPAAGHSVVWAARVDRVGEAIDAATQSTSIIVRVADPYSQAAPGERPPLRRNTFVEVVLMAPPGPALVAPLDAVRGGKALVVSAEGRLERREVSLGYSIGDLAVIADGLAAGDRLVVTDPAIAVPGMEVKPVEDKQLAAQLAASAAGAAGSAGRGKGTK
ncbi:efflux RND transporter periplasmic adaptor subunit [Pseudodonghicola flavimaris]|uniref:HlyD family efflux transporter periplasmic adaptor subunit n=1 Tax=Pseudodonghicola flavimaris TaxID=3050036 RepID=A0ABT7F521_9RHOB|nr:HlyD family efflux transporter periplasmic adaptor subunit [Pseudodonghicola flavimaris]MDK3019708.1 HlyD family efflux transporter periplasmic adaptor subunit [Pseudodonghicola flavimaris]